MRLTCHLLGVALVAGLSACNNAANSNTQSTTSLIGPLDAVIGTCVRLQIIAHHNEGNAPVNTEAITYTLASTSSGGTFYSEQTCSQIVTTTTVPSGTNFIDVFYKDTAVGNPTLTVAYSGSYSITSGVLILTEGPAITAAPAAGTTTTSATGTTGP